MRLGATLGLSLARRFLFAILAMFGLTFIIIVMSNYVDQVRMFFGTERFDLGRGFLVSLYGAPATAETVLPFAVLFGSMITLIVINRRLEFTIVRSAGISIWRFLIPGALVAFGLGVVTITAYDPLASALKKRSLEIGAEILPPGWVSTPFSGGSFWLRQRTGDGDSIIGAAQTVEGGLVLAGVTAFVFAADGALIERVDAGSARLGEGAWIIPNARVSATGGATATVPEYRLETNLSEAEIRESLADPDTVPLWRLPELIRIAQESSLQSSGLWLRLQSMLQMPLLLVAMVIIAGVVSLRFSRTIRIGRIFISGAAAGFAFYVVIEASKSLGRGGVIPPTLAAWAPAVLACLIGFTVLLYAEDG